MTDKGLDKLINWIVSKILHSVELWKPWKVIIIIKSYLFSTLGINMAYGKNLLSEDIAYQLILMKTCVWHFS